MVRCYASAIFLLVCARDIISNIHVKELVCEKCEISLEPTDPVLKKYAEIVFKIIQNRTSEELILISIENATYQEVEGILYKFTLNLGHSDSLLTTQKCRATVHQGYKLGEINVTSVECQQLVEIPECQLCNVPLDPRDPVLQKYVKVAAKAVQESLKLYTIVVNVKNPTYRVSDGILYTFNLIMAGRDQEMGIVSCIISVHQGYTQEDVNVTQATCELIKQNTTVQNPEPDKDYKKARVQEPQEEQKTVPQSEQQISPNDAQVKKYSVRAMKNIEKKGYILPRDKLISVLEASKFDVPKISGHFYRLKLEVGHDEEETPDVLTHIRRICHVSVHKKKCCSKITVHNCINPSIKYG